MLGPTAIVAALPEEIAPLRARLPQLTRTRVRGLDTTLARLGAEAVVLAVTGDGARNAGAGIAALLEVVAVSRLIVIGVAGALTPDLEAGALVVAARVHDDGGASVLVPEEALVGAAARACGGRPATVITSARLADTPAARRTLLARAGVGVATAVADLESAIYARAAAERGVPWVVLRAVSDTAAETLPALLERSRDPGGAVRRGRVLRGAAFSPGSIPALVRLRARLGRCAQALAVSALALLPSIPEALQ